MTSPSAIPLEIDVRSVHARLQAHHDFVLVDCREADEHALVRIEGALLLPMSQWPETLNQLATAGDRPLVVYCHHGGRSLKMALALRGQGFPQAQSMAGGIDL